MTTPLDRLRRTWNSLGQQDPMWAILSDASKTENRWDRDEFFATGRAQIEALLLDLNSLDGTLPRRTALDVGCGIGRLTQALAVHFEHVEGVDIARSMIERARLENAYGDRVTYTLVEGAALPGVRDRSVDLICCFIVLQHMPPAVALSYVREFVRVLSREGVAVFEIPHRRRGALPQLKKWVPPLRWASAALHRARQRRAPLMEMHVIPRDQVGRTVTAAGGTIVRELTSPDAGFERCTYYVRVTPDLVSPLDARD
jgi:SAM-dependent methyltransferase